jgi:hypothetical protein
MPLQKTKESHGEYNLNGFSIMVIDNSHLLEHNSLGHTGTSEGVGLDGSDTMALYVRAGRPALCAAVVAQLASRSDSSWLMLKVVNFVGVVVRTVTCAAIPLLKECHCVEDRYLAHDSKKEVKISN